MANLKIDKKSLTISFKCKTVQEMRYVLDVYTKGNQKIIEEATKVFTDIPIGPRPFLVKVEASVYDNDENFIVIADTDNEAITIIKNERSIITNDAKTITCEPLISEKTLVSKHTESYPNGKE